LLATERCLMERPAGQRNYAQSSPKKGSATKGRSNVSKKSQPKAEKTFAVRPTSADTFSESSAKDEPRTIAFAAAVVGGDGGEGIVRLSLPVADTALNAGQKRQLFRAEIGKRVLTRLLVKKGSVSHTLYPISDDETDASETVAAVPPLNCEYYASDGSSFMEVSVVDADEAVREADILHVLTVYGTLETKRIARRLRQRGFERCTKSDVNPLLYRMENVSVFRDSDEHKTPLWKAVNSERTSYDELVDLAKQQQASLNVVNLPELRKDGNRIACTLIWRDGQDGIVTGSGTCLSDSEAKVYAAHALLRDLMLKRPLLTARVQHLYQLALVRGIKYVRGNVYPGAEHVLMEWKGGKEEFAEWGYETFKNCFRIEALKITCGMWNTYRLDPSLKDQGNGKIMFGIHCAGVIQGVWVDWDGTNEHAKKQIQDHGVRINDDFADQLKACQEIVAPGFDGNFKSYYSIDLIPVDFQVDAKRIYFVVEITVKKMPLLKIIACSKDYYKRSILGHKAETVKMSAEDLVKCLNQL
jgi:hypothetical protein